MHFKIKLMMLGIVAAFMTMSNPVGAADSLVFGIHPYKSPTELIKSFKPLSDYLSEKLGRSIQIRISKDYKSHIEAMGKNEYDFAYIGPASYIALTNEHGMKPLIACQEVNGKPTFQGKIIVRKDSDLTSLGELKGKRFAFGDVDSTMSHLVPRYMLWKADVEIKDMASHAFLGSHDNVALAVLAGDYDAGAVKEEVFYKYESRGLKVLATTPALTEHNFVASSKLDVKILEKLRNAFYALSSSPDGKSIMDSIKPGITAMVPVNDKDYENLREILSALAKLGVSE